MLGFEFVVLPRFLLHPESIFIPSLLFVRYRCFFPSHIHYLSSKLAFTRHGSIAVHFKRRSSQSESFIQSAVRSEAFAVVGFVLHTHRRAAYTKFIRNIMQLSQQLTTFVLCCVVFCSDFFEGSLQTHLFHFASSSCTHARLHSRV